VSLFTKSRRDHAGATAGELIPPRLANTKLGTAVVNNDTALHHSAVWACLRLRANLISTMPVDAYRKVDRVQIEVTKPPVLVNPGGERVDMQEFLYSSQFDLDRGGNVFGLITERNGYDLPARIDLQELKSCAVVIRKGELKYRIAGKEYEPEEVWHERQYTVAGLPVGLSPVAAAAWSIGEYLSIAEFALDWFGNAGVPSAHLRNTAKEIKQEAAEAFKARFKNAVRNRDIFVTGNDWEYDMIQADQAGSSWLEAKGASNVDIARYFDCPADLIDAAVRGDSITYANIAQRNLQLLIMNLNPATRRRENALSKLLPQPRYVKLNRGALLEMDPKSQVEMFKAQIESRQLAPSEARALLDRPPFTEAQLAEFDRLFGEPRAKQPAAAVAAS
jgi:HK97 family phage portal protein